MINPLEFEALYPGTGRRTYLLDRALNVPPDWPDKPFVLRVSWPKDPKYQFIEIRGRVVPPQGNSQAMADTAEGEAHLLEQLQITNRPNPTFAEKNHLLSALVNRGYRLEFEVTIDTECNDYFDLHAELFSAGIAMPIATATIPGTQMSFRALGGQPTASRWDWNIPLAIGKDLPAAVGTLSLDFGTTGSMLCQLRPPAGFALEGRLEFLSVPDVDFKDGINREALDQSGSSTVPSYVRIEKMIDTRQNGTEEYLGHYDSFEWDIGSAARPDRPDSDGLIVSPKRLLGRAPLSGAIRLRAGDTIKRKNLPEYRPISSSLPAELNICRLLQLFQAITVTAPRQLSITYPTTYLPMEVAHLRETVYRAWKRLRRECDPPLPATIDDYDLRDLIPVDVDEATAAAVSLLARRFLNSPGALLRFQYLHPHGFHLLVVDCGGGTTDISLVRAFFNDARRLEVRVIGRTGVREFGGDNITTAVFKLLKAKLAAAIVGAGYIRGVTLPPIPQVANPARSKALTDYLETHGKTINSLVPTQFTPGSGQDIDRQGEVHTLGMWDWADQVKRAFVSQTETVSVPLRHEQLLNDLAAKYGRPVVNIRGLSAQVSIDRKEVDALIYPQLEKCVDRCNYLILDKLLIDPATALAQFEDSKLADKRDEQIDCVCIAGNASRYPLVREMLKDRLCVPYLAIDFHNIIEQERQTKEPPPPVEEGDVPAPPPAEKTKVNFDENYLKSSVAHGAAMALALPNEVGGLVPDLKTDFTTQLPFSVHYLDQEAMTMVLIWPEGMLYKSIKPFTISPAAGAQAAKASPPGRTSGVAPNQLVLYRKWPGDKEAHRFIEFQFPSPTTGDVSVRYDVHQHCFRATAANGVAAEGQPIVDEDVFRSPAQRGNL